MENPTLLLRRARQYKHSLAAAPPAPAREIQTAPPAPRHTSSHASYSALMRSHDRISTRHIAPRSHA